MKKVKDLKLKKQTGLLNDLSKDCINFDDFIKKQKENEKMNKTNYEIIKKLDKRNILEYLDVADYVGVKIINSLRNVDDVLEYIDSIIQGKHVLTYETKIIYHDDAMDILKKYDASLKEVLFLANDFGYHVEEIDSPILASLLMYDRAQKQFNEYKKKLRKELEHEQRYYNVKRNEKTK